MARPLNNWIPVSVDLQEHYKTHGLAEALEKDPLLAMAHLVAFWCWCFKFAPDGKVTRFSPAIIARAARFQGDAEAFLKALIDNGFVDEANGELQVHDWYEHGGMLHRIRANKAENKAQQRRAQASQNSRQGGGVAAMSPRHPSIHDMTEHDRKGQDTTGTDPALEGDRLAIAEDSSKPSQDKKEPKVYPPEVNELVERLAQHVERVNDRKPKLKERTWHLEIERLLRIDEWSPDEAQRVMDYAFEDRFWRARVQNGAKFREFSQTIRAQMRQAESKLTLVPTSSAPMRPSAAETRQSAELNVIRRWCERKQKEQYGHDG